MSPRPPVFISGPYRADSKIEVQHNVYRATRLAYLSTLDGYTPYCPHAIGFMDGLGDDDGEIIHVTSAMAYHIGSLRGYLWEILRDDGELSAGQKKERGQFELGLRHALREEESLAEALATHTKSQQWDVWMWLNFNPQDPPKVG
jgi:hypothetical protein